ncbi:MAG: 30S ribosomal protein S13, partial [Bacteroidota bacterium]|nr:30S ribosomal protein S13 [Bacteroidota bacterium]
MARIAGIDLPRNKRGIISLQYIYGIGASRAKSILEQASISEDVKVQDWTDDNVMNISRIIQDTYKVEGELRS